MERDELLKLDRQLCFAIYACSREVTRLYRPILEKLNLTYPQYLVLLVLWEQGRMTVKELGERLYLDSGTLTPLLKRMETAELVTRTRSQSDERKVYIQLTEKGQKLKEEAYAVPETLIQKTGLSGNEFVNMLAVFQDFLKQVHEINQTDK